MSTQFTSNCYYDNLLLQKNASAGDIRRAYKKLAVKWHPDKNRNKEDAATKFKVISEAYQVLSDPEARSLYDRYGKEGKHEGRYTQGSTSFPFDFHFQSPEDIFRSFFGSNSMDSFFDEAFSMHGFGHANHGFSHTSNRQSTNRPRHHTSNSMNMFGSSLGGFGFGGSSMLSNMMNDSFFNDMDKGSTSCFSTGSSTTTTRDGRGRTVTQKVITRQCANGEMERTTEEYINGQCVKQETTRSSGSNPTNQSIGYYDDFDY